MVKKTLLQESLSAAKKKYLDTGEIFSSIYNKFLKADPSKNKKYIEWMCETYIKGYDSNNIIDLILAFDKAIKTKYELPSNDINYYNYNALEVTMKDFNNYLLTTRKMQKQRGVEKIYENDKCILYYIKTKEACQIYGAHTEWCITSKKAGHRYWEQYSETSFFVFLISKINSEKLALVFDMNLYKNYYNKQLRATSDILTIFDTLDSKVGVSSLKPYNLTRQNIFAIVRNNINPEQVEETNLQRIISNLTKNNDGTYTVKDKLFYVTELMIDDENKLKIKFKESKDFAVHLTGLVSLEGCPDVVNGYFSCLSNDSLTSLEGGPKVVKNYYSCQYNNSLTTLKGAPKKIGDNGPEGEDVKGLFICTANSSLKSLEYTPECSRITVNKIPITDLTGLNPNISTVYLKENLNLTSLKGLERTNCTRLTLHDLPKLSNLQNLPPSLTMCNISYCSGLKSLKGVPNHVWELDCGHCPNITSLEGGPQIVDSKYEINNLPIVNLKGMPTKINGSMYIIFGSIENTLTSLEGLENCEIKGLFYIDFYILERLGLIDIETARSKNKITIPEYPNVQFYAYWE